MRDSRARLLAISAALAILAIGIVLGSGPLRAALLGEVGDQIDSLQAQVDAADAARQDANRATSQAVEYVDAVAPALLAGRLSGVAVLMVTVDGADPAAVDAVRARVVEAGGEVSGRVALGAAWADPATAPFREALAEQVLPTLVGLDAGGASSTLAHAFVQGATGGAVPSGMEAGGVDQAGTDRGGVLWSLLSQADLATGEPAGRADAVVLVAGADDAGAEALATAFAAYDAPVVAVGGVDRLSAFAGSRDIATVEARTWELGSITAVGAVIEGLQGTVSHYGDGEPPAILGAPVAPSGTGN